MFLKEKAKESISLYLCRFKNVQNFFAVKNSDINADGISSGRELHIADNADDFAALCEKFGFTVPDADINQRFGDGDRFALITENGVYGCWGWFTSEARKFYVLEIDAYSDIPGNVSVLYHYFSNPAQRRKGFYYDLLRLVAKNCGKEYSVIYAYDTNPASKGAIKKAGFRDFGEMNHKNFCGFAEIIKRYGK